MIRGYLAIQKPGNLKRVTEALAAKQNLRLHVSAKKVQKRLRGILIRRRIEYVNKTASYIQAHFRMRWFRNVFTMIRKNTMVLQRAVRRYMARRVIIKERMKDYLMQEF